MLGPARYNQGIVYFSLQDESVTLPEAVALSQDIRKLVMEYETKVVVADARALLNDYPPEIDRVFIELFKELPQYIERYVAICHNAVSKLETNYIFKQVGVAERFKAFVIEDQPDIDAFVELPHLTL